jgi:hypothetical protein
MPLILQSARHDLHIFSDTRSIRDLHQLAASMGGLDLCLLKECDSFAFVKS